MPGFGAGLGMGAFPWLGTPLCASPLFPLAPDCSQFFGGNQGAFPPPTVNANPTTNLIVVPPPPPPPVPVPIASGSNDNVLDLQQANAAPRPADYREARGIQDESPPIIVLKTGGMYSITKYWIRGRTLYFQTTAGDTLYAPVTQLDRVIPGRSAAR